MVQAFVSSGKFSMYMADIENGSQNDAFLGKSRIGC